MVDAFGGVGREAVPARVPTEAMSGEAERPADNSLLALPGFGGGTEAPSTVRPLAARRPSFPAWAVAGWRTVQACVWQLGAAAAAILAVVASGLVYLHSHSASAAVLIEETRRVHSLPVDRCYLAELRRLAAPAGAPWAARVDRLWTRGDRFFLESTNALEHWAWGRDPDGSVWLACAGRYGLRFEADEVPLPLAQHCDLLSMRLDSLLEALVAGFDLTWDTEHDGTGRLTKVIHATGRPGRTLDAVLQARLEIDAETKVVRRLALERAWRQRAFATVTYTLVDSAPQSEALYELAGHLDEDAEVYSGTHLPERRQQLLDRLFGHNLRRWRQEE